jgi:hypothetical protein
MFHYGNACGIFVPVRRTGLLQRTDTGSHSDPDAHAIADTHTFADTDSASIPFSHRPPLSDGDLLCLLSDAAATAGL